LQIHSRLGQFIVFSRKNMQFTEIIYHRKRKNQGGLPPFKRSAGAFLIRNTILTPGLSSAALAKEEGRKLHPSSSAPQITP